MLPAAQLCSGGFKTAIDNNNVSYEAIFNMQQDFGRVLTVRRRISSRNLVIKSDFYKMVHSKQ